MTDQPSGGAQSGAGQAYLGGGGIVLPQTTGASASSRFGLDKAIGGAKVTVGALLPGAPPGATAEQVMSAFSSADPQTIARIQSYLYKGGFYPAGTSWSDINIGVLSPADVESFKKIVTLAAQSGSDRGPGMDVSDYLRRQAAWGVYQGATSGAHGRITGSGSAAASASLLSIEKPDPKALGAVIDSEFRKLTGRKPDAGERAGFIAAYTNAFVQMKIQNEQAVRTAAGVGQAPTGPGAFGDAAPSYGTLVGSKDLVAGGQGGKYTGPLSPAQQAQQDLNYSNETGIADMGVASLIGGGIPNQVNAKTAASNQAAYAKDQAFLAYADQPLPGMPGYSTQGGAASATGVQTVLTQQAYDPQAYADEFVRSHNTAEVGGHDATNTFSMFLSLLKGGMQ